MLAMSISTHCGSMGGEICFTTLSERCSYIVQNDALHSGSAYEVMSKLVISASRSGSDGYTMPGIVRQLWYYNL
jgi:hypothetical protein